MRPTNLRNIDLNLLPILDILLDEKSVTLASQRVHLSQSATSSALRRLRETFNDPILVRDGNNMVASPKARLIQADLKESLQSLGAVVSTMRSTDPAEQNVDITIAVPEYVAMAMSDILRTLLQTNAGTANINLVPFSRTSALDQLERGDVDIVVGAFGRLNTPLNRTRLFRETLAVGFRNDHPRLRGNEDQAMALQDFTAIPHLVVTGGDVLEEAWISKTLAARSIERKVGAMLPNLSLVADVLKSTEFICVGTRRSLDTLPGGRRGLTSQKLPSELGFTHYDIELFWHDRTQDHALLSQIRDDIVAQCQRIDG